MDIYFKKEITYPFKGHTFIFDLAHNLFSTFDVDHGTDILLRAIDTKDPKTILDIGCGYGAIGIVLAHTYTNAEVTLVDRDLLAVRYATTNIQKNNLSNAQAVGSIGLENLSDQKFDLIVSNIPAKIGDDAITKEFILDPVHHLNPGGEYWIVVVNALNRLIPSVARKHNLNCKEIRKRNGHTVYKLTR